jgi:hypothetical protein
MLSAIPTRDTGFRFTAAGAAVIAILALAGAPALRMGLLQRGKRGQVQCN